MSNGIKISLPGKDVQTCIPLECSLHSDYTAFKSRLIGIVNLPANSWVEVPHGFGYAPAYSIWHTGSISGLNGVRFAGYIGLPNDDGSLESYVTTSSLFLRSSRACTAYYYLYADDAGTISSNVPTPSYGEFGLMISREGVDVKSAKPYQLNFLSTYPNFKLMSKLYSNGLAISKISKNNPDIGGTTTFINWDNAGSYGERGTAVISGYLKVSGGDWHWIERGTTNNPIINDDLVSQYGVSVEVQVTDLSTGQESYLSGRYSGDGADRKFFYTENGQEKQVSEDNGWSLDQGSGSWVKVENNKGYWLTCFTVDGGGGWNFSVWWNLGGVQAKEYIEEFFSYSGTSGNQFTSVSRGQLGTSARNWRDATEVMIAPVCAVKRIGATGVPYVPCYFAWTISAFEASSGAFGLPFSDGDQAVETIISGGNVYAVFRRRWQGENDSWGQGGLPYVTQGVYLKLFYDEVGT